MHFTSVAARSIGGVSGYDPDYSAIYFMVPEGSTFIFKVDSKFQIKIVPEQKNRATVFNIDIIFLDLN